jgi:hypothetical protein
MNRAAVIKLESLRRALEARLFEKRGIEFTAPLAIETLHKIRELEAKPVSLRAYLPSEQVIVSNPERFGPMVRQTLKNLEDVLSTITDYNWSRQ